MKSYFYTPLSPENSALVLIDQQVGLLLGVRNLAISTLKNNVLSLAKTAKAMEIPIVTTTIMKDEMWGPIFPELSELMIHVEPIDRTTMNAFLNKDFEEKIKDLGREKLILAGISLEVCVAFTALSGLNKEYEIYVAADASGSPSKLNYDLAIKRLLQADVVVSNYTTLMSEALGDNTSKLAASAYSAMNIDWAGLLGQTHGAYVNKK